MKKLLILLSIISITYSTETNNPLNKRLEDTIVITSNGNNGILPEDKPSVTSKGSIAIGIGSKVSAPSENESAFFEGSIAIGYLSDINGSTSTAIGWNSNILSGRNSIAIGTSSQSRNSEDAISIGSDAISYVNGSIALGNKSSAGVKRTGEKALFSNEIIEESGVLSLGHKEKDEGALTIVDGVSEDGVLTNEKISFTATRNTNLRRQIINLAGGVDDYDAVNIAQLKAVERRITILENSSNISKDYVDENDSYISNAVAMANLPVNFQDGKHSHSISASYGNSGKNHAFALGFSGQGKNVIYKASVAINTKAKFSVGAGLGYSFYKEKLVEENELLKEKVDHLEKRIEKLENIIKNLK